MLTGGVVLAILLQILKKKHNSSKGQSPKVTLNIKDNIIIWDPSTYL